MEDQRKLCLSRLMYTLLIASLIISVNLLWIYPTLIYEIQRDIYMKNVEYLYFNVKDIMILNIKDTLSLQYRIQIINPMNKQISFPTPVMECISIYSTCVDLTDCGKKYKDAIAKVPFYEYGSIYWPDGCQGVEFGPNREYMQGFPYYLVVCVLVLWNVGLYIKIRCMYWRGAIYDWLCTNTSETLETYSRRLRIVRTLAGFGGLAYENGIDNEHPTLVINPINASNKLFRQVIARRISIRKIQDVSENGDAKETDARGQSENRECIITMEPIGRYYYHCSKCHKNFDLENLIAWVRDNRDCPHCRCKIQTGVNQLASSSFILPECQMGASV